MAKVKVSATVDPTRLEQLERIHAEGYARSPEGDETVQPERGDVWLADVPGDKRRPVVVLTRTSVLPRLTTILVAPVTTRVRQIPTEVPLGPARERARQEQPRVHNN